MKKFQNRQTTVRIPSENDQKFFRKSIFSVAAERSFTAARTIRNWTARSSSSALRPLTPANYGRLCSVMAVVLLVVLIDRLFPLYVS